MEEYGFDDIKVDANLWRLFQELEIFNGYSIAAAKMMTWFDECSRQHFDTLIKEMHLERFADPLWYVYKVIIGCGREMYVDSSEFASAETIKEYPNVNILEALMCFRKPIPKNEIKVTISFPHANITINDPFFLYSIHNMIEDIKVGKIDVLKNKTSDEIAQYIERVKAIPSKKGARNKNKKISIYAQILCCLLNWDAYLQFCDPYSVQFSNEDYRRVYRYLKFCNLIDEDIEPSYRDPGVYVKSLVRNLRKSK